MFKKTKLAIALVVAISAMGVAASSAFAVTAAVNPGGSVAVTSAAATFEGSGIAIVCPLTLTTSLLRGPITIAANNQIGEVTAVRIGSCTGGSVETVLALPWRVTINSTNPAIGTLTTRNAVSLLVNIVNAAFNLSVFGGFVNCLYRGNAGANMPVTHTARESVTYTAATLEALRAVELPFVSGSGLCPRAGHFAGTFTLGTTQTITLA